MTMHQFYHLKPILNIRLLADAAGLSYEALSAKLYRYGVQGRKSELTAPESQALDAALARHFLGAGLAVTRSSASAAAASTPTATARPDTTT